MQKVVLWNCLMNLGVGVVFVFLNDWALRQGLEETFVSLAILYGLVLMVGNAVFVWVVGRKRH